MIRGCLMNVMLLLSVLNNSLNISSLLKITSKKTDLGACCKNITKLFICTDNAKSMRISWKHRCEPIYISRVLVLPLNWARQLCSAHDWLVQLNRKSIILFRLARRSELKMKMCLWGASRALGLGQGGVLHPESWGPGPGSSGAQGSWPGRWMCCREIITPVSLGELKTSPSAPGA